VSGGALLKRAGAQVYQDMVFAFATAVSGFGAWVFDDSGTSGSYQILVTEVDGTQSTSSAIDGAMGGSFWVEGFLGVTSDLGITEIFIRGVDLSSARFYEVDHLQISTQAPIPVPAPISVPEPGTLALLGIGLAGIGLTRRRKKV